MARARVMLEFSQSLDVDWQLAECDITGSIAHAAMLQKIGILSAEEYQKIERGLNEIRTDIISGKFIPKIELEDVHMNIESRLTEKIGSAGAKLHTGRSRNDQIATTVRLFLRKKFKEIAEQISKLLETLLERAEHHSAVIVPGYTHLQQAQPITMGHYWMAHFEAFSRDLHRLQQAADAANECPLGAGALAGSTLPLDRDFVSGLLGFSAPTRNSLDTVASRDYMADYHHFASLFSVHVSRLAEDFVIYSTQEFGWLILGDEFCTGSSMMPQKKNPDAAELLRGKTGQIIGHALDLLITLKGTPMTYDRDLQEDKRGLFASINTILQMLSVLVPLIAGAEVNEKRARESLERGFALATDVAEYLVNKGVPFRTAHQRVAKLVRSGIDINEWREHIPEASEDIFSIMTLDASVARRTTFGGTAPQCVREQIKIAKPPKNIEPKVKKIKPKTSTLPLDEPPVPVSLTGYFDGASRGNPGVAGAGAWLADEKGNVLWEGTRSLGERTNNEAEYSALIMLLEELRKRGATNATVKGDSKLIIEQMSGRWKVKEPRLQAMKEDAATIAKGIKIKYEWIEREKNAHADTLSNRAIDENLTGF